MGASNSKLPQHCEPLADGLWTLHSPHNRNFIGMQICSACLLIKTPSSGLVVINPPSHDQIFLDAVRKLCHDTGEKVTAVFSPGDWHHAYLMAWATAFPDANLYVASERVLTKQPALAPRLPAAIVVDTKNPSVPELAECCTLLPWLGCKQPPWIMGGDTSGTPRAEHVILHNPTSTLFVTDHLFGDGFMGKGISFNTIGFSLQSGAKDQALESAQRIIATRPRRLVFSHGDKSAVVFGDGTEAAEEVVAAALENAYKFCGAGAPSDVST